MALPEGILADSTGDLKAAALFLTRLPLGRVASSGEVDLARAAWSFPLVGLLVGLIGAIVYRLAHGLGLPAWPAAALAVAATLAATGCLHEDGLADTADGFGGGATRERKLEIMRDSRIGAFGVCALTLSLLLRVGALASLAGPTAVVVALFAAHSAARATLPAFMYLVPPARADGMAYAAGRPTREAALIAGVLGILIVALFLGPLLALAALILLVAVMVLLAWLSLTQIDGQTGDVLGALEQVGEIVVLLVALR
jgi:adenosylcobinamide-GDP ribazoletransferase